MKIAFEKYSECEKYVMILKLSGNNVVKINIPEEIRRWHAPTV